MPGRCGCGGARRCASKGWNGDVGMHAREEEDGGVGEKGIFFSSPAAVRWRRGMDAIA